MLVLLVVLVVASADLEQVVLDFRQLVANRPMIRRRTRRRLEGPLQSEAVAGGAPFAAYLEGAGLVGR